tara:strand:+ start:43 stop:417 length:375 start_codon:yes stop_codon:yes gene_type:complete
MSSGNETQSEYPTPLDNSPWEVTPQEVHQLVHKGEDFLLLDCRTSMEWEDGSIHNAIHLPLQQFSTRFNEIETHREKPIVVFCKSGNRSVIVAKFLQLAGFRHVRSMSGGYEQWLTIATANGAS